MVISPPMTIRRHTHSVKVGDLYLGSDHSIKNQSMTTTPTADVEATVNQIYELVEAGCEIVRVTVQGIKESLACEKIKEKLLSQGITIPLVADIHFFPQAAMHVTDFVDKVRINPGNFVDKRNMFTGKIYTDKHYADSLLRLEDKFSPLIEKCKRLNKAMRIGVNHGSLSERIMQRYGDSITGMVISALEYIEICEKMEYRDVVFSMKSSNPKVMIAAYRQLAKDLDAQGWHYPLHLGVTEAGMGTQGMIKSAIGIGTLLTEGLGDTIRCSITGSPTEEIPICHALIRHAKTYTHVPPIVTPTPEGVLPPKVRNHPWGNAYGVFLTLHPYHLENTSEHQLLSDLGIDACSGKKDVATPDGVIVPEDLLHTPLVKKLQEHLLVLHHNAVPHLYHNSENEVHTQSAPFVCYHPSPTATTYDVRSFFAKRGHHLPVALVFSCALSHPLEITTKIASDLGALLIDELGDAVILDLPNLPLPISREIAYGILQSTGTRIVKTEYISCPGCGRTLFDLPEVTQRIQKKTQHLTGLKIAIMGCIVNGLGEMADADFGFVGSKTGMVDLYIKNTCVKAHIPMEEAEEELISLLKAQGVWKDPK